MSGKSSQDSAAHLNVCASGQRENLFCDKIHQQKLLSNFKHELKRQPWIETADSANAKEAAFDNKGELIDQSRFI